MPPFFETKTLTTITANSPGQHQLFISPPQPYPTSGEGLLRSRHQEGYHPPSKQKLFPPPQTDFAAGDLLLGSSGGKQLLRSFGSLDGRSSNRRSANACAERRSGESTKRNRRRETRCRPFPRVHTRGFTMSPRSRLGRGDGDTSACNAVIGCNGSRACA
jgi:hypothetical protein